MREKKFYEKTPADRLALLIEEGRIDENDARKLSGENGLDRETANFMIENVIGTFSLPIGVARGFIINGEKIDVPMVIEEPSVVAAASNAAKLAALNGGFSAEADAPIMIGQLQLINVPYPANAVSAIRRHRKQLLEQIRSIDPVLTSVGGGPVDLKIKFFKDSPIGSFLVVYLYLNVADAMGANAVNSALEKIAPELESLTGGEARLRILSNLAVRRLARARCVLKAESLRTAEYDGESVAARILDASALAEVDPYRAVTHNKGILNGIDAVLLATGNDWRAVEAGAHGFAAKHGKIFPLSRWEKDAGGNLIGTIELPMAVGTVGGATRVHPAAQAALKMMNVDSAKKLAGILAAVGLAQNLAALRALGTVGIQKGHLSLHARQVAIAAGAVGNQIELVAEKMRADRVISTNRAKEILSAL